MAEMSCKLGCATKVLTGGQWEQLQTPKGNILQGHVRVPLKIAQEALSHSGTRGIFITILHKHTPREKIAWSRKGNESTEEYFRATMAAAKDQGCPLAFRLQGAHNLGIIGGEYDEQPARARQFTLFGVPTAWEEEDIIHFVEQIGWNLVDVMSHRRSFTKQASPEWVVRALPPEDERIRSLWSFSDVDSCITIAPEAPRRRKQVPSVEVSGPKKRWIDKKHQNGDRRS